MTYPRKTLLSFILLLATIVSNSQNNQECFFENIGWTITLPHDFILYDFINESRNMQQASGVDGMDDEYDETTDLFASQTMLLAIKDRFNYFNITITPFDPEEDGSWEVTMQSWKHQAYKSMAKLVGFERLDTVSSVEYIDGLAFSKFQVAVRLDDKTRFDMVLLGRWYNGFDCCINYLNLNAESKKQIETMLLSSRFRRTN
jgi:hypothetical protein